MQTIEISQYNDIKKGDKLKLSFDSVIKKNHQITLIASGKFRKLNSSWAQSRVILKEEGGNFKYYLYLSKKGGVSLAIGNMATSNLKVLKI